MDNVNSIKQQKYAYGLARCGELVAKSVLDVRHDNCSPTHEEQWVGERHFAEDESVRLWILITFGMMHTFGRHLGAQDGDSLLMAAAFPMEDVDHLELIVSFLRQMSLAPTPAVGMHVLRSWCPDYGIEGVEYQAALQAAHIQKHLLAEMAVNDQFVMVMAGGFRMN